VPPVLGQVRTVTVTVYVTLIQTVAIPVPVTYYVTVASVATSFITFATTAVSISLGTVTLWNTLSLWNTVTAVTTAMGVFGAIPSMIFGPYTDAGLMGLGTIAGVAGVAVAQASRILLSRVGGRKIAGDQLFERLGGRKTIGTTMSARSVPGRREQLRQIVQQFDKINREIENGKKLVQVQLDNLGLSQVGDDAQLANIDMQNALQNEQALVTMLSNISKMVNDSARARTKS